jgi:hypothetical protein
MSATRKYKTLRAWIDEALTDTEKDGTISGLALMYKKPEGGSKEVHAVKLGGKTWDAEKLSDLFIGKAESYAQDLPGIQRFEILAFYKSRHEAEASHNFIVVDGEVSQGGASRQIKESPDATGLTAQLMRHLEKKDERLTAIVETFATITLQVHQKMVEEAQNLRTEVNDAYQIVREMTLREKTGEHEMRMKELQMARDTKDRETLFRIMPALVNTASGKEIFPQGVEDTSIIESMAEKVSADQIKQLVALGALSQEVAAPLILRLERYHKEKQKVNEGVKQLPEAKNTNGGIS